MQRGVPGSRSMSGHGVRRLRLDESWATSEPPGAGGGLEGDAAASVAGAAAGAGVDAGVDGSGGNGGGGGAGGARVASAQRIQARFRAMVLSANFNDGDEDDDGGIGGSSRGIDQRSASFSFSQSPSNRAATAAAAVAATASSGAGGTPRSPYGSRRHHPPRSPTAAAAAAAAAGNSPRLTTGGGSFLERLLPRGSSPKPSPGPDARREPASPLETAQVAPGQAARKSSPKGAEEGAPTGSPSASFRGALTARAAGSSGSLFEMPPARPNTATAGGRASQQPRDLVGGRGEALGGWQQQEQQQEQVEDGVGGEEGFPARGSLFSPPKSAELASLASPMYWLDILYEENEAQRERMQQLEVELEDAQGQLEVLQHQLEELCRENELAEQLRQRQEELMEAGAQLLELEKQLAVSEEERQQLLLEHHLMSDRVAEMEANEARMTVEHSKSQEQLAQQLAVAQRREEVATVAEARFRTEEEALGALRKEVEAREQKVDERERDLDTREQKLRESEEDSNLVQVRLQEEWERLKEQQDEVGRREKGLQEREEGLEKREKSVEERESELEERAEELRNQEEELQAMQEAATMRMPTMARSLTLDVKKLTGKKKAESLGSDDELAFVKSRAKADATSAAMREQGVVAMMAIVSGGSGSGSGAGSSSGSGGGGGSGEAASLVRLQMDLVALRESMRRARQENFDLRDSMGRVLLTTEEKKELALKCCYLTRYWSLAAGLGIHAEVSGARMEAWQRMCPLPLEVISDVLRRAAMEDNAEEEEEEEERRKRRRKGKQRQLETVSEVGTISEEGEGDGEGEDEEDGEDEEEDDSSPDSVESMCHVERAMRELSALKVEEAVRLVLAEHRRPMALASLTAQTVQESRQIVNDSMELDEEEKTDLRFKQHWVVYWWRRALRHGLEPDVAADRVTYWVSRSDSPRVTAQDIVDAERGATELMRLGVEEQLWEVSRGRAMAAALSSKPTTPRPVAAATLPAEQQQQQQQQEQQEQQVRVAGEAGAAAETGTPSADDSAALC